MLDKGKLTETVERLIDGTDVFLVDLSVSRDNRVVVEIDSTEGIDIETCERITNGILDEFNRDVEDYELEVGSAGLTSPFKVPGQYIKNIGNRIEILTRDGRKLSGVLVEFNEETESFTIETERKVKVEGKKRPEIQTIPETFKISDTKQVKAEFK